MFLWAADGPVAEAAPEESELGARLSGSYLKALEGFLMVLSEDGDMIYLSENVHKCLGLAQVGVLLFTLGMEALSDDSSHDDDDDDDDDDKKAGVVGRKSLLRQLAFLLRQFAFLRCVLRYDPKKPEQRIVHCIMIVGILQLWLLDHKLINMISDWWFAVHAELACHSLATNCIQGPLNYVIADRFLL